MNYVFPTFITTQMPIGLVGLLIAAIFAAAMSTIAGELAALSTATVIDFYRRFVRPTAERSSLPDGVAGGHRVLGAVRQRGRGLGGGARLADRGREPLRLVLLRLDSRRVHPGGRRSRGRRRPARSSD